MQLLRDALGLHATIWIKKVFQENFWEKNEDKIIEIVMQRFSSLAVQSGSGLKVREVGQEKK